MQTLATRLAAFRHALAHLFGVNGVHKETRRYASWTVIGQHCTGCRQVVWRSEGGASQ